jgi:hypothetical protein
MAACVLAHDHDYRLAKRRLHTVLDEEGSLGEQLVCVLVGSSSAPAISGSNKRSLPSAS